MTDFWKYPFLKIRLSSPNSRNFCGAFCNTSRVIRPGNLLSSIVLPTAAPPIPKDMRPILPTPNFPFGSTKAQFMYRKIQGPCALQVPCTKAIHEAIQVPGTFGRNVLISNAL